MIDDSKTPSGWRPRKQPTLPEEKHLLENGQLVSHAGFKSIHRHYLKQMKPIYRIQETVYFVMRNNQPE